MRAGAELDDEMAQLLAKLSVLSEVAGRSYDSVHVHGGERSGAPSGPSESLYDTFHRRYSSARSETAKSEVIEAAEQALTQAQLSPRRHLVANTLEWRVAIATDPRSAGVVAWIFGCTERHVYRLRAISKTN